MSNELIISLDKLDLEYLEALCERTGKNSQDVIKLALVKLYDQLCASEIKKHYKLESQPEIKIVFHEPSKTVPGMPLSEEITVIPFTPYQPSKTVPEIDPNRPTTWCNIDTKTENVAGTLVQTPAMSQLEYEFFGTINQMAPDLY